MDLSDRQIEIIVGLALIAIVVVAAIYGAIDPETAGKIIAVLIGFLTTKNAAQYYAARKKRKATA